LDVGEYEDAAECALACLQQAFFNPQAHFRLGQAMSALGRRAEARRALQNAVEQAPNYGEAHYRLAEIAEADGDLVLASDHRRRAMGGLARTTP
jgi:tetratricopeptide (TPR) repeat protein